MRVLTVVVTAVLIVPFGACSDDDDGEQLSAADWTAQMNEICAEEGGPVEAAGDELFAEGVPDNEALKPFLDDVLIPRLEALLERTGELEPPADLQADATRLHELTEEALDKVRDAAESDDPLSLFQGEDPFAESDALALELGVTDCTDDDEEGEAGDEEHEDDDEEGGEEG